MGDEGTGGESAGRGQVTRGSLMLALSIGANALGGLVFWLIAARVERIGDVGEASALFQSLLFVNFAANLGLPVLIGHYATGSSPASTRVANAAMVVRTVAALLAGGLFCALAWQSDLVHPLVSWNALLGPLLFVLLGLGAALAVLFEVRLIALRRWDLVVARSAAVAVARLPLLLFLPVTPTASTALLLFVAAAAPIALSGFWGALWLRRTVDRPDPSRRRPDDPERLVRYALVNWFGLLSTQGPVFLLPVIVAFSVDSADNATFYVAWSFGAIVFMLPQMVGQVVLSEATASDAWIPTLFQGLRIALALTAVVAIGAQVLGGVVADVYGPDYADVAHQLPLVVAAGIGWSYTSIGLAAARLKELSGEVLLISGVFFVSTVVPTLVFTPSHGAGAAVWSWLAGTSLTAAVTALRYLRWRLDYDVVGALHPSPAEAAS